MVEGYGSEDQAWKLALDSPSALTTSLFGPEAWARGLLERLPGGVIFVNEVVVPSGDPRLAFGGNRVSGYGRTRGAEGLYEMTRLKSVATRRGGRQLHLRPPTDIDHFILHGYLEICHAPGIVQKGRALAGMILSIARERAKA